MATKKKGFGSAADTFLGAQLPVETPKPEVPEVKVEVVEKKEAPVKKEPVVEKQNKKELKTKSVLIKLTPSLYEKVKAAADEEGLAFNSYVTTLLVKAVKK